MFDNDLLDEMSMGKYDSYVDAMFEYKENERDFDKMIHALEGKGNKPIQKKKIGRNDQCPCGSGKKYKHCCLNRQKEAIDLIESPEERNRWLKRYPYTGQERIDGRIYLTDYFDATSIETGKILYLALMNRKEKQVMARKIGIRN